MDDAVAMHVLQTTRNLIGYHLHSLFTYVKVPSLEVIKEIRSSHVFEHDEVVGRVLEQVNQSNYVLVLTNFQYFDLASLLENFYVSHVFLFYLLDCDLNSRLQMSRHFHQSKLALTKRFFELVKIKNIAVSHNFLKLFFPSLFFSF